MRSNDCIMWRWETEPVVTDSYPYGRFGEHLDETKQDAEELDKLNKLQKELARLRRRKEIERIENIIANGGVELPEVTL